MAHVDTYQRFSTFFFELQTLQTQHFGIFLPFLLLVFSHPFCEALEMKHAIHGGKVHCVFVTEISSRISLKQKGSVWGPFGEMVCIHFVFRIFRSMSKTQGTSQAEAVGMQGQGKICAHIPGGHADSCSKETAA